MGEANENRRRRNNAAMKNLFDNYPRDLLQRFMASSSNAQAQQSKYLKEEQREEEEEEEEVREEIELNLGLSLGGRFGVDKSAKNKLIRSSSIACTIPSIREADETTAPVSVLYPTLMRTASLPTETEEEWRKRKELQSLRRLEAKRRRSEKQKNPNPNPTPSANKEGVGGLEEERKEIEGSIGFNSKQSQYMVAAAASSGCNRFGATVASPFGFRSWAAAAARQPVVGGGIDVPTKGMSGFVGGMQGFGQPNSQGSVESQGGSSSGMSEFESKPVQGSSSGGEARSPASNQSSQERSKQETLSSSVAQATENTGGPSGAVENPSRRPELTESRGREIRTNALEGMPYVFTKGDGPNGRRIEGILYKYGKGEEVRIICVCHGSFLSPAEFVKHAGGGDVAHPLRHIVVNPSSNSFL